MNENKKRLNEIKKTISDIRDEVVKLDIADTDAVYDILFRLTSCIYILDEKINEEVK